MIDKPFMLRTDFRSVLADLRLQKAVNGRTNQLVVLEVKCFGNPTHDLQQFYGAVGQYLFYTEAIRLEHLKVPLYLAVPVDAYERLIRDDAVEATFAGAHIQFVLVDIEREEVVRWIT